jgi:DNA gyrase subunit B
MGSEYSKQITPVLSLVEAVRKRPGMYFGNINSLAVNNAIYEVIANSVDQYLVGLSSKVSLEFNDYNIRVCDDGAGLPFDKPAPNDSHSSLAEYYLMNRHDSPTADDHAPHIHLVGGGLGLAIVNVASERLTITSSNGSIVWKQTFGQGRILSKPTKEKSKTPSGTIFEIQLDKDLFENNKPDHFDLRKTMFELAHFYPGLVVEFQGERFVAKNGLLDLAYIHYQNIPAAWAYDPPSKFFYSGVADGVQIQVAAIGETDEETKYISWVNGTSTIEGGTHVEGLKLAFNEAGWNPRLALIQVIMHDPRYAGPSKDALRSIDVKDEVKEYLSKLLIDFRNKHAEQWP